MLRALMLAAALLLAGEGWHAAAQEPAIPSTPSTVRPIVIGDDDGGIIETYVAFYERIAASGVPVRVDGICISACTLVLLLPPEQLCVTDRTSFGFHSASDEGGHGKILVEYTKALWRRYYPPAVRAYLEGLGDAALKREPIYADAGLLYTLGVRRCE